MGLSIVHRGPNSVHARQLALQDKRYGIIVEAVRHIGLAFLNYGYIPDAKEVDNNTPPFL